MTDGAKNLEAAFEESLSTKADSPECVSAALGAYVAGVKTIRVADEPDMVWCRIGSNESDRVKAFNTSASGVGEHWDLPVIICRDPLYPSMWRVAGRDLERYETWGENYGPALPPHGLDHSFGAGANTGADPVWVFKRQIMPLLPRPVISGSTSIYITADFYYFDGEYRFFGGTGTIDLMSNYGPTGTYTARFVTCYLDGNEAIQYLAGDEFNAAFPPTAADVGPFIPVPLANEGVPIAAVYLSTGTSQIPWRSIYDLRFTPTVVPGTGTWFDLYDEASLVGSINEIHVEGSTISAAVTGSVGYITDSGQTVTVTSGSFLQQEEIYNQAITSITGSIVFSPIPQTYQDLRLVLTGRIFESTGAGVGYEEIEYVWNGITGSVFSTFHWEGGSDGGGGSEHSLDNLTNSAIVGRITDGQGTMTGTMSTIDMTVRDYTITGTQIAHDWYGSYHRVNLGVVEPFAQHGTQLLRNYEAPLYLRIKPTDETVNFEIGTRLKVTGTRLVWLPTNVSLS